MFIENEIKIGCSTLARVECGSFATYFYKDTNPLGFEIIVLNISELVISEAQRTKVSLRFV